MDHNVVHFSAISLGIPQGFRQILECLTREVLKERPENIVPFAVQVLENLVEQRESQYNFFPIIILSNNTYFYILC